nr:bifunctional acetate--CoA ligase family protein/GNAT family N-acetyltransferase [Desulfosalsimonas propionicica]
MFHPGSVALIGASQKPGSIGTLIAHNLVESGFTGDIFFVNPKYKEIEGRCVYPDVDSMPKAADLAVIATPPDTVPRLIEKLGKRGTRAAVVISAGFRERGNENGSRICARMLDAARPRLLRIVGPNCLGIMVPGDGLNASFGHIHPLSGKIAFAGQSGAVQTSILDWATSKAIGFSHFISMGNMSDVDFGDVLDYLAGDFRAGAILLYIENITHARKFMSAARAAARMKPVIVVKSGRHRESAHAAASHTGALAGTDPVYDAAFRRAGVLRVTDMLALFDAVETLAMSRPFHGDGLVILTNGGGMGVLATDVLMDKKGRLAELSQETTKRLSRVLPPTWSHGNPVDIIGDAPSGRYADALRILLEDKNIDAILIINCPTAMVSGTEVALAVVDTLAKSPVRSSPPGIFTSWLGIDSAGEARKIFSKNKIPSYETPGEAVRGFMQMVRYRRGQNLLMETPPNIPEAFEPDTETARRIIRQALSMGGQWLTEIEAKAVLAAYKIPVVKTFEATSPEEAAAISDGLSGFLALKILSPDIPHKSDIGGVALHLVPGRGVAEAARNMMEKISRKRPDAKIYGFSVQPMVNRPNANELIIGVVNDIQFGPVILFGQGGTAVEIIRDMEIAIPPLNMQLAREAMSRTRVYRLLKGYRGKPAANMQSIAMTLVKVSQLICDIAEIQELDINPLLVDENGVIALDARIRAISSSIPAQQRLAIRPYPRELEEEITLADGQKFFLRPIRPEDEPALLALFSSLSREAIRLRFLHAMKTLPHEFAARLTQIDYDREMALVLCDPALPSASPLYGTVRLAADPDNERAEYAVLIHGDWTGRGLGTLMMRRIIDYARQQGIGELYGEVLAENRGMLKICNALGFSKRHHRDAPELVLVSLPLQIPS